MYSYKWNRKTGGYTLVPQTGKFVAAEIRPVFAEELKLIGFDEHFDFDENEKRPICWAKQNTYLYRGEEIAKLEKTQYGRPLTPNYLVGKKALKPVDVESMLADPANVELMAALVADTQKRIKELYDQFAQSCDGAYIAFSGGKDSVLLLDLCHRTLPLSVPVVFSDTDMELPDTYEMWKTIQERYPERTFLLAKAPVPALENWKTFGPPSQTIRWCCTIHKSTPAIIKLREFYDKSSIRTQALVGVRNDESFRRSTYEDVSDSVKNTSQVNTQVIREWSAHELWLFTLAKDLPINHAYRKGLTRVGCILCPESSERHIWFVNKLYPEKVALFNNIITKVLGKTFVSKEDEQNYLACTGWRARRNGTELINRIDHPDEKIDGSVVTWLIAGKYLPQLKEWLQTLGVLYSDDSNVNIQYRDAKGREHVLCLDIIEAKAEMVYCRFAFENTSEIKVFGKNVRLCMHKAISCVGCRACEVECGSGALTFTEHGVKIDSTKCKHCLRCHSADYGCWSFKSRGASKMTNNSFAGMGAYQTFGLREEWVSDYVDKKENFSQLSALGVRMIPSARTWFRQAGLMKEGSCEPCKLLQVAEVKDVANRCLWDSMWMGLVQHSAVVKWFVTATEVGKEYTPDDLFTMIGNEVKDSTKKSGLSALRDMLTKSPFGTGNYPVVQVAMKGKQVASMTRVAHAVEDLALLYGMFLIAAEAEQSAFSVSQLMNADFSAKYISPLVAFAMPVAEFKQQCQGLANRYGDFIHCNFTLGLDEIKVKTDDKTIEDVVDLMLNA